MAAILMMKNKGNEEKWNLTLLVNSNGMKGQ